MRYIVIFFIISIFSKANAISNTELYQIEKTFGKIERAILTLKPNMKKDLAKRVSVLIGLSSKKYNLDPRIMISIMKVESAFNQSATNPSGDFSIAQINYRVWEKEFKKLKRKNLDFTKLKKNDAYSIFRMAEILSIEKKRYKGKKWYLTYHSRTKKYRDIYEKKFNKEFKKIKKFGPNILKDFKVSEKKIFNYYKKRSI